MIVSPKPGPKLRATLSRYRDARRSLRVPASRRSRYGLDWTNFFVADMQAGFGSFVAFYLAHLGWSQASIGLALTVDGLGAVAGQIPGGALADAVKWKRGLAACGIVVVGTAALAMAIAPSSVLIYISQAAHGLSAGITTGAIASISLGLAGRRAMSSRVGRNYRFSAAGAALTAGVMGLVGSYFSSASIFLVTALLALPGLISLSLIRAKEIDYARARNARTGASGMEFARIIDLRHNRKLLIFAVVLILFQIADASILPVMSETLGRAKGAFGSVYISVLIIVPQIIVAVFAPWVGYHSEKMGRKPLLLLGLGAEVVRVGLLIMSDAYPVLVLAQVLNGISGATIGVLTILIVTDLTSGTGRFNLARGVVATFSSIAASVSTTVTGYVFQVFGHLPGFLALALIAGGATIVTWILIPETKPAQYVD